MDFVNGNDRLVTVDDFNISITALVQPDEQLDYCTSIFKTVTDYRQTCDEVVAAAWNFIKEHKLYYHVQPPLGDDLQTSEQILQHLGEVYGISSIVATENRKQQARQYIREFWNESVEAFLGDIRPSSLSRNLLEELANFAGECHDASDAKTLLVLEMNTRGRRSRNAPYVFVRDVKLARETKRSRYMRMYKTLAP